MSGYRLRPEFAEYDAERVYGAEQITAEEPKECIAALVLRGLKKPVDCAAFGTLCTPESPLGAPMVSSEGVCAAYHAYRCHDAGGDTVDDPNRLRGDPRSDTHDKPRTRPFTRSHRRAQRRFEMHRVPNAAQSTGFFTPAHQRGNALRGLLSGDLPFSAPKDSFGVIFREFRRGL